MPGFRNPLRALESVPADKGGYCTEVRKVNSLSPKCKSLEVHR